MCGTVRCRDGGRGSSTARRVCQRIGGRIGGAVGGAGAEGWRVDRLGELVERDEGVPRNVSPWAGVPLGVGTETADTHGGIIRD